MMVTLLFLLRAEVSVNSNSVKNVSDRSTNRRECEQAERDQHAFERRRRECISSRKDTGKHSTWSEKNWFGGYIEKYRWKVDLSDEQAKPYNSGGKIEVIKTKLEINLTFWEVKLGYVASGLHSSKISLAFIVTNTLFCV